VKDMASLLVSLGLRAPPPDPVDQMKEWQKGVKKEVRQIDRDIKALEREEKKHIAECQKLASRDKKAMMITAKSIVQSRRAKEKMYMTRATMSTLQNQLATQASMLKVSRAIGRSAEVMKSLNELMKVGKMSADMQELQREMIKAGLVEEMMNEAFEDGMGEDVEDEASAEVDKILLEVVPDMPLAVSSTPAVAAAAAAEETPVEPAAAAAEDEEDAAMAALQARASAL